MSQFVTTQVVLVSANEVSDEEAEEVMESRGFDSLEEVAEDMEEQVESLLATRVFADADNIPILSVETEVQADWTQVMQTDYPERENVEAVIAHTEVEE